MIAKRMSTIDVSGIRKVFDLAKNLKNPINLSIGQPDFDIPEEIKQIGIDSIKSGFNKYTQTQGIPELNEALKSHIIKNYSFTPQKTMITSGVSGGLLLIFMALIEEGDEVIIPDPYFVMYKHLVKFAGGTPVFIDTYPDFDIDPDKLKKAITKKTKMIILNSPGNPTGKILSEESVKEIAAIADKYGLLIVSDEIYKSFSYDMESPSIASYYPEKTVLLNGFSKNMGMPGWRIGYAAGPSNIIEEMIKLQQYTFVCAPSFAQVAVMKALDFSIEKHREEYKIKRDYIYSSLREAGYKVNKPDGAFYIFPECPYEEDEFIKNALNHSLLIIPGSIFSEKNTNFRISFSASMSTLEKGAEILKKIKNG